MRCGTVALLTLLAALAGCKSSRKPVTVFAAASLARALSDLEERVEQDHPTIDVLMEISGSQVACRKIAELNRRADVVAVADHGVIDDILVPGHAGWSLRFATNAVVLAHMQHSRHTEKVAADNWHRVLLEPRVRLGRVDPDLAPIGYRTLLVWQLAERHLGGKAPGLARRLEAKCPAEHVVPHEGELLKLLQTRTIDYAFLYRSTAEEHNLKTVELPDAYNLGAAGLQQAYARVSATVQMRSGQRGRQVTGSAVIYGLTIPNSAPNASGARVLVEALLADQGRRCLARTGFNPLRPARSAQLAAMPGWLKRQVKAP